MQFFFVSPSIIPPHLLIKVALGTFPPSFINLLSCLFCVDRFFAVFQAGKPLRPWSSALQESCSGPEKIINLKVVDIREKNDLLSTSEFYHWSSRGKVVSAKTKLSFCVSHPREIDPGESLDRGWQLPEQLVDFGRRAVGAAQQDDFVRLGQRSGDFSGDLKFCSRIRHRFRETRIVINREKKIPKNQAGLCQHLILIQGGEFTVGYPVSRLDEKHKKKFPKKVWVARW